VPQKSNTERKVQAGFAIALLFLGIIGVASWLSVVRQRETAAWVEHTHEVLGRLEHLFSQIVDAQNARRAYVISGQEEQLKPHFQAVAAIQVDLARLHDLFADNPEQQRRLAELKGFIDTQLALADSGIELRRTQGFEAVRQLMLAGRGEPVQRGLRRVIEEMKQAEQSLLAQREARAQRSARTAQAVIAGGSVLAVLFVALALIAIRRDFAGRARAEAELERFFSLSLDFLCISSADGYFKRVSPAVTDILGWSVDEFLSRPFLDFVHPEDHAATLKEVERQVVAGEKVLQFENRYRHKSGSWRVLSWRSTPQPGGLMYATARDVTQNRETQRALADANEHLEARVRERTEELQRTQEAVMQQERLHALGQMASGIAHDINNAISPVALYTESLLENEPGLSERTRGYLTTIQRAIDDVAQTVSRMREFYRQREPQMVLRPVDLNLLVGQVVALTRAHWSDMAQQRGVSIDVRTELTENLPEIRGADNEIREALTNLIFNAVDAMPGGGHITLRTRLAAAHRSNADNPSGVELEVIDSGVGMDEETRARCLEPFFTTKGERGTGLGLAMVYGAVKRHSAEIEIDSAPGRGTTVRLRFAAWQASTSDAIQTNTVELQARKPLRILVVDDDPLLLASLHHTLATDGHEVTEAEGGQAGIDTFLAAQREGKAFPLVISDLGMPQVDGRKVAAAIKEAAPATAVLLLTGWGQRMVVEGDIPPGVDAVLSKPPKMKELREVFTRLVKE